MLIHGNKLIGLKVVTINDGKQVNRVKDIIYDPKNNEIDALIVEEGGLFSPTKIILYQDIESIGDDAVMIASEDNIRNASNAPEEVSKIAKSSQYLVNTKVMTEQGTELGKVHDIIFNSDNGHVEELEVTPGVLDKMLAGNNTVKITDIVTIGEDVTIVKGYTQDKMSEQSRHQGVKRAVGEAGEKMGEGISDVKNEARNISERTAEKAKDVYEGARTNVKAREFKRELKTDMRRVKHKIRSSKEKLNKKAFRYTQKVREEYQPMVGSAGGRGEVKDRSEIEIPKGTKVEEPDGTQFQTITKSRLEKSKSKK